MRAQVWGARGSVAAPGPETNRYGGNTSCVAVELSDGALIALDAGTGIRGLGLALAERPRPLELHILLTHLHLDHIQGLMFFAPCFLAGTRMTIWGPPAPESSLQERIARYISAPLSPVEVRELPCEVDFCETPAAEWGIGAARIRAEAVTHRGPTLGYRIEDAGRSLCYIPDHELGLAGPIAEQQEEWISGFCLARDVDLLIHDGQYTDAEYPAHVGWGHSALSDSLAFAARARARELVLFHHDPLHDDDTLDRLAVRAREGWAELTGRHEGVSLAAEGQRLEVGGAVPVAV